MYDFKIRYLASVFLDADSITAEPELTMSVLEALKDKRFIPFPLFEENEERRVQRIAFISPKDGFFLRFGGDRFDLSLMPTEGRKNIGEFADFCEEASGKLIIGLKHFDRKARRLAAVREGLLPEMDIKQIESVANKLLKLPQTFAGNPPFEWDWRVASHIERKFSNRVELTNTIVTAQRRVGAMKLWDRQESQVDSVRIDLDINTIPANVEARFGGEEVKAFFKYVVEWHDSLEKEIVNFLELEDKINND